MNRINLLYKMDGLLEVCKKCEKNGQQLHHEIKCAGCSVYPQLREIGNHLGRKKQVAKLEMTVDEYIKLKHEQKLPVSKIAELKGVSEATVYYWQNNRQGQINMALGKINYPAQKNHTTENKPSKCNCLKDEQKAEYERLIKSLQEQVMEDKDLIHRLKTKVSELENLHAACDDVENEVSSLREEKKELQEQCGVYFEQVKEKDYALENWKRRYKLLSEEHEQLDKQNKTMRELIRQWA